MWVKPQHNATATITITAITCGEGLVNETVLIELDLVKPSRMGKALTDWIFTAGGAVLLLVGVYGMAAVAGLNLHGPTWLIWGKRCSSFLKANSKDDLNCGGREKIGVVGGRSHSSRGAEAADSIWAERDCGREDQ
jgi:hypothetical protein